MLLKTIRRTGYTSSYTKKTGVTLIELLLAAAIGVIITVLAMDFLVRNLDTRRINAAYGIMKDNGSIALLTISKFVRASGISPSGNNTPIYGNIDKTGGECYPDQPYCTSDSNNSSDVLAVIKEFPIEHISCNGQTIPENTRLVEVFYLININNHRALVCRTLDPATNAWFNNAAFRVIQAGIDDLQFRYFERGQNFPVAAGGVTSWNNVQGVEIAVVANSEVPAFLLSKSQTLIPLGRQPLNYNDQRVRQIFQVSVIFNNQALNIE